MRRMLLLLALGLGIASVRAAGPAIAIDAASPAGKVSPLLYGLMTEEINHAYDGGLYAELVRNRAFLDDKASAVHWSIVQGDGAAAEITLDPGEPLNAAIGTSLRLDVAQASAGHAAGIANDGYWGIPVSRTPAIAPRSTRRRPTASAVQSRSAFRAAMAGRHTPAGRLRRSRPRGPNTS